MDFMGLRGQEYFVTASAAWLTRPIAGAALATDPPAGGIAFRIRSAKSRRPGPARALQLPDLPFGKDSVVGGSNPETSRTFTRPRHTLWAGEPCPPTEDGLSSLGDAWHIICETGRSTRKGVLRPRKPPCCDVVWRPH